MTEALKFEELRVLRAAEAVADDVWRQVVQWDAFAREVVGGQLARAADSIGANIAEAFGRFHYGERLQFLYYARGSLFETKYWLNRALERQLMPSAQAQDYASRLTDLARQLNSFAAVIKDQRYPTTPKSKAARESAGAYDVSSPLFTDQELAWLVALPIT